jgi:hypothetical protein
MRAALAAAKAAAAQKSAEGTVAPAAGTPR